MKYVYYFHPDEFTTRLYITDKIDVERYSLSMGFIYLNAYHSGNTPEASMFYGQEMSLVDNYDEGINENTLVIDDKPFPKFCNMYNTIIKSSKHGEEQMKAVFWDVIWGEKNESGNWY